MLQLVYQHQAQNIIAFAENKLKNLAARFRWKLTAVRTNDPLVWSNFFSIRQHVGKTIKPVEQADQEIECTDIVQSTRQTK